MRVSLLLALFLFLGISTVQSQAVEAVDHLCDDGTLLTNVTTLRFNYRQGQYTVSVIGIGDFDPILAIEDATERELGCIDDSPAFDYAFNLPTTGEVASSSNSVRAEFNVSGYDFIDVYFYVGNSTGTGGEFLVIFEDVRYTVSDRIGDNVFVSYTEDVAASIPVTAYMFAVEPTLDPIIYAVTPGNKPITIDGDAIACDDAGTPVCYGDDESLEEFEMRASTQYTADLFDAMLVLPPDVAAQVITSAGNIKYALGGYNRESEGEYMAVFHIGVDDPDN